MTSRHQRKGKGGAGDGCRRVVHKQEPAINREELLADTEDDPRGAEEFVKLLHELRREPAAAALKRPA